MLKHPKSWLALILFILVVIFALQNMAQIEVNFLGFTFPTRRFFVMLICIMVGFILGKTIRFRRPRSDGLDAGNRVKDT